MSAPAPIPFLDLAAENAALRSEIDLAIARVLDSGQLQLGRELTAFERELAEYNGVAHAVGVASGLAALKLMLQAFGIGPGDEVIVPAHTFIATWLAVSHVGARPVPVEPNPGTRNLDTNRLKEAVTERTRAVLAVHLYGVPCDMDALNDFCKERGLRLLVDAAHSCGASWNMSRSACLGDAAAFSFYPTKNLGSLGDAGAVVTRESRRAERVRLLRNYGMKDRYHHELKGENARMEELHAAVLRAKLRHLEDGNARRRKLAEAYREALEGVHAIALQEVPPRATPVWHLFTVCVSQRDRVAACLDTDGIGTAVHYPVPPHLTGAYRNDPGGWTELPITEQLADSLLSLPHVEPGCSTADRPVADQGSTLPVK
jgi:dTDP-3-amino-3,4,6-trideoxy-alpha-D-glucose transaminase